jgi:hypothetical protein
LLLPPKIQYSETPSRTGLVGVTAGVGALDGIGIDNSFSGCTGVDVTEGVGVSAGVDVTADVSIIAGVGVTTSVGIAADVGAFIGFRFWKFLLLTRSIVLATNFSMTTSNSLP